MQLQQQPLHCQVPVPGSPAVHAGRLAFCLRVVAFCQRIMSCGLATLPTNVCPNRCVLMVLKPV
jgi:hypothetical protein